MIIFQQLINLIKLEAVTNFYKCVPEQNILRTHSVYDQEMEQVKPGNS